MVAVGHIRSQKVRKALKGIKNLERLEHGVCLISGALMHIDYILGELSEKHFFPIRMDL